MKKCPKCGTILDDSKIKCYVCGTDLQRQTLTYGNSFNENIGATVSNNQGNVLSNNRAINGNNINQVNGSFSAGSNFSNSLYNNQLNNLNSMAYDDRTALEKMFSSDERFKSKAEINAQAAMRNNQRRNNFVAVFDNSMNSNNMPQNNKQNNKMNNNVQQGNNVANNQMMANNQQMMNQGMQQQPMQQMPVNNNQQQMPGNNNAQTPMFAQRMAQHKQVKPKGPGVKEKITSKLNELKESLKKKKEKKVVNKVPTTPPPVPNNANTKPLEEKKEKPPINWGNDLAKDNNKDSVGLNKIKMNTVFNIVALVISIVGVLFVYFRFIKHDSSDKVYTINGLKYSISKNFILKEEKNNYRLYTYGEFCSIGISYGATNAVSTYIDNLFEMIQKDYDSQHFRVSKSSAKYNDNTWTEISVTSLANNAASANGYTTQTKIQYVAIVYEGNYYTIGYQNTNNNTVCSADYDSFLKTLAFK